MKNALLTLGILSTLTGFVFAQEKDQVIDIQVTEKGFEPGSINVKAGSAVTLKVTRKTNSTCATKVKVQNKNIEKDLPLNQPVSISLGRLEKGEVRFACGMEMVKGQIIVK